MAKPKRNSPPQSRRPKGFRDLFSCRKSRSAPSAHKIAQASSLRVLTQLESFRRGRPVARLGKFLPDVERAPNEGVFAVARGCPSGQARRPVLALRMTCAPLGAGHANTATICPRLSPLCDGPSGRKRKAGSGAFPQFISLRCGYCRGTLPRCSDAEISAMLAIVPEEVAD